MLKPTFTIGPIISKQLATLLTKESDIEMINQQLKSEVKRNSVVGFILW